MEGPSVGETAFTMRGDPVYSGGMISIRPAAGSDIPYFYEICLKTGDAGKDATALFYDPWILGQYYAAPYLFFPGSLCFAAEHEGIPGGYILCAPDTAAFNLWMDTVWLPPLRQRYKEPYPAEKTLSYFESNMIMLINRRPGADFPPPWYGEYPAHLHIDLLPEIQGRGTGRKLIETLLASLGERGCPGLHLGVSRRNAGARAFYEKAGFAQLEEHDWGFTLGRRI
jgi:ribosomal protein S18 acetylase RimI-like enzyme